MIRELHSDDPASVGPYRLLGRLGTGGMGQVFLGQSPGGWLVAVKVIRPELADEPGFRARFAREVAAARNVSGLFTALVVDADAEAPVPWLATAYVAGPSLAEAVSEHGPLPVPSVLSLAAGLAEGLGMIHAAGVVHRDLKPANVLLADDGPRVIDFGVSRAIETSMLTQSGTIMGSPGFLSPEQADGGVVGPPSDVFSLGAVLTFAATGEGPFGTGSPPALMYRVVNREPSLDGLPAELRTLVGRCLAKDPAARPTPAGLLAELGGSELAVNWLPEAVAAGLGRYAPPGHSGTGGAAWLPTDDIGAAAPVARTPTGHGRDKAASREAGESSGAGRRWHGNRRRATWLAAAAAVLVLSSGATAFAVSASGPNRSAAEPPARPVAAISTASHSPAALVQRKTTATAHPAASRPAKRRTPKRAAASAPSAAGSSPAAPPTSSAPYQPAQPVPQPTQAPTTAAPAPQPTTPAPAPQPTTPPPAPQPTSSPTPTPTPPSTGVVPDLMGDTLSAAAAALKAIGFDNIPYLYDCYGSPDIDDVVQQNPGAGASISLTSPVQLYLQADNCATVPNVIGMDLSNAAYTLKQVGYTNIPYVYGCYGSPNIDDVVSESPSPGTSYGENQPVSLELQADNC